MCSATQAGLRVLRSKAEMVERVGRRSDIGPGKPYWKRPEGFTGLIRSFLDDWIGTGVAGDVGVVGVGTLLVGLGGTAVTLQSRRDDKNAAEAAAPAAAETPAMIATVVFDILRTENCEAPVAKEKASAVYEILCCSRNQLFRCVSMTRVTGRRGYCLCW